MAAWLGQFLCVHQPSTPFSVDHSPPTHTIAELLGGEPPPFFVACPRTRETRRLIVHNVRPQDSASIRFSLLRFRHSCDFFTFLPASLSDVGEKDGSFYVLLRLFVQQSFPYSSLLYFDEPNYSPLRSLRFRNSSQLCSCVAHARSFPKPAVKSPSLENVSNILGYGGHRQPLGCARWHVGAHAHELGQLLIRGRINDSKINTGPVLPRVLRLRRRGWRYPKTKKGPWGMGVVKGGGGRGVVTMEEGSRYETRN